MNQYTLYIKLQLFTIGGIVQVRPFEFFFRPGAANQRLTFCYHLSNLATNYDSIQTSTLCLLLIQKQKMIKITIGIILLNCLYLLSSQRSTRYINYYKDFAKKNIEIMCNNNSHFLYFIMGSGIILD